MNEPPVETPRPGPPVAVAIRPLVIWALLIPIAYAPSLVIGGGPSPRGLLAIAAMTGFGLLAVQRLAAGRLLDRVAGWLEPHAHRLLWAACIAYFAWSVIQAVHGLGRFGDYPMAGIFSQSYWTLLQGQPFANSHETIDGTVVSHFGLHFSPTLLLLTPFYALWPHALVLMTAQSLALALAPIPLFALLRPRLGGAAALALGLGLLAIPIFARAGAGDFHDSCLLPAPLLASVWALETRRRGWLFAFVLLALGIREDAAVTVAMLGVYAAARGQGLRLAVALVALSVGWFVLGTRVIMPMFWTPGIYMDSARFFASAYGHWGATPLAALRGVLTNPVGVARWLASFELARFGYTLLLPLLLLPPFLDLAVLLALPSFALSLMSRYAFMHAADAPYSFVPLTFFLLACAGLAARVTLRFPAGRRAAAGLAAAIVVLAGILPSTFAPFYAPAGPELPPAVAREVMRLIPSEAAVYAPVEMYPAMCNRETYNCFWNTGGISRDAAFRARHAFIVLWPPNDPPGERRDAALVDSLAGDPNFEPLPGHEPLLVYRRR